jgi:hypothetical protein
LPQLGTDFQLHNFLIFFAGFFNYLRKRFSSAKNNDLFGLACFAFNTQSDRIQISRSSR